MMQVAIIVHNGVVQEIHAPSNVLVKIYDHDTLDGGGVLETHWIDGECVHCETLETAAVQES